LGSGVEALGCRAEVRGLKATNSYKHILAGIIVIGWREERCEAGEENRERELKKPGSFFL
jgi:hypothetical protein